MATLNKNENKKLKTPKQKRNPNQQEKKKNNPHLCAITVCPSLTKHPL